MLILFKFLFHQVFTLLIYIEQYVKELEGVLHKIKPSKIFLRVIEDLLFLLNFSNKMSVIHCLCIQSLQSNL